MSIETAYFVDSSGAPLTGLAPVWDTSLGGVGSFSVNGVASAAPAVVEQGGGFYRFALSATDLLGVVTGFLDGGPTASPRYWAFQYSPTSVASAVVPPTVALRANALATVAQLQADRPDITADNAARFINAASDFIENVCGRKFQRVVGVAEKHAGRGSARLSVVRTPLESIASITLDGSTVAASAYEIDDEEAGLIYSRAGWQNTAQVIDAAGPFALPGTEQKRYLVTYTGGYHLPNDGALPGTATALPSIITEACLMVATTLYGWKGTDLSVQAESVGNASVQYGGGVNGRKLLAQAVAEMLADYVRAV